VAFEEYRGPNPEQRGRGLWVRLYVGGSFGVSHEAAALLGLPSYVVLGFDRERRLVGLRAAEPDEPGARLFSSTSDGPAAARYVSGAGLLTRHRIVREPARFVPRLEGAWLVFGPVAVAPGVNDVRAMLATVNGR
jgi:hypothetical protein